MSGCPVGGSVGGGGDVDLIGLGPVDGLIPKKIKRAKLMRDNGISQLEIAEILGVGRTTLYWHLK
ncbi:helix-turn-helix domain-containing protein [Prescottella agglutinans]|uniref:DNA-binding CsgD family transcriptional regulator n=1 Tax=Prescottella agglutinans TaxID=1644129 RepID=A0ABT6MKI1_9NOCA|nr:helix-turn-helix domain-containing protein [Prescottella agglutinans]MDH6284824.1 DNA-binding CsgD family transcriptional regulator [Prescottella agglutinans]